MSKRAIFLGGKRSSASGGTTTYEVNAFDDWGVDEGLDPLAPMEDPEPTFVATPAAGDGRIGSASTGTGYATYAMMFVLDVASSATISSATLTVKTASDSGTSATWLLKIQDADNTSQPVNAAAATSVVDRCEEDDWSLSGVTPSSQAETYTIDVKTEIEAVIARGGWSSGNNITLLLSGPVEDNMGTCTGSGDDDLSDVETVASSSGKPKLTVVYT
tara:strand:+ start:339 stop:989 length:651 start_codon:yes stop_codon:yes gene_type:complete